MSAENNKKESVCVAIVTFNRLPKLKKSLLSISNQEIKPDCVYVFDNGSNNDTKQFLEYWKDQKEDFNKYVDFSSENKGGSYGFFRCQEYAVKAGFDWVLLIDDDAYLDRNYISSLLSFKDLKDLVGICGKVLQLGSFNNAHRAKIGNTWKRDFKRNLTFEKPDVSFQYIELFSFVGIMIRTAAIKKAGYPDKDMFIWFDDTEQSLRISKVGKIVCLNSTSVVHDIVPTKQSINWKTYYGVRNNIITFKKHFPLQLLAVLPLSLLKFSIRFLKNRNYVEYKMRLDGIWDGLTNKKGINKKYIPNTQSSHIKIDKN